MVNIAGDFLDCQLDRFGKFSLEHIVASTFLLDLLASNKYFNGKEYKISKRQKQIKDVREAVESCLHGPTQETFKNYILKNL